MHEYYDYHHVEHRKNHHHPETVFHLRNRTLGTEVRLVIHTDYCPHCMLHLIKAIYAPTERKLTIVEDTK